MRIPLSLVVAVATLAAALPGAPAAAAGVRVGIRTVQYDSPGATVPAVVTAYGVPRGWTVRIDARGTGGASAVCRGGVWRNPIRRTASRMCYLRLPSRAGTANVRGAAVLTRGTARRVVTGVGGRPVRVDGRPSPRPMPEADIRRIERCGNTGSAVRLTFDDGGSPAQVRSILATLRRHRVRGWFFFRGDWARRNPALMRSIRSAGHAVGNHTDTHPALSRAGRSAVLRQIDRGTAATGTPKLLRPPFGAGAFSTRLQRYAAERGYRLCRWTADTYDWEGPSAARMVERIRYGDDRSAPVAAGGNILMHGHGRHTAAALPGIIAAVRAKGLTLEPLRGPALS